MKTKQHIVIVGGGAGGLELATKLGHKLGKKNTAKITLVDRNAVHIWKPLLHEVATGSMDTEIDGVVYRAHAAKHHYQFQVGDLSYVDSANKTITLAPLLSQDNGSLVLPERKISYDTLVLAIGSTSNDFGTPGVSEHCYMLDSSQQAQRFQRKLLNSFLRNSQAVDENDGIPVTKLAIVGAGATGVELSAELYHVVELVGNYDVDNKPGQRLAIELIEAGPRILPALPERIADAAAKELEKLGVTIHRDKRIVGAQEDGFIDADGNKIEADLMVWSAGVKSADWLADIGLAVNRGNQIVCHRTLKSENDTSIYAIGDCCGVEMADGQRVPPRAQSAHQMASVVAKNIQNELKGLELVEFKYKDYGSLVNLSRFSTVGSLMGNLVKGSMFVEGRIARLMYLSLYRMHQLAIHGYFKGSFIIIMSKLSKLIRPKMKLH
ncbi:MAG: NAD(P)/FAD-dependent oxidoreductase [Arenicella sp.]